MPAEGGPGAGTSSALRRAGAVSAGVGGALWAVKAALILATGEQPAYAFEVAPPFFALALVGLAASAAPSRKRKAGAALAAVALGAGLVAAGTAVVRPDLVGEEPPAWVAASLATAFLATIASLVLLGLAVPSRLALALGAAHLPALLVGGLLSAWNERLLEVPLLLLAIAWVALGVRQWASLARA